MILAEEYPRSIQGVSKISKYQNWMHRSTTMAAMAPSAVAHHAGPQGFSPGPIYGHFDLESHVLNMWSGMGFHILRQPHTTWASLSKKLHNEKQRSLRCSPAVSRAWYCWINPKQPSISSLHTGSILWATPPHNPWMFHGIYQHIPTIQKMGPVPPVHTSTTIYGTHFWIGPFLDHEKWRQKPHQLREFLHAAGGISCGPDLPIHGSRDGMGKRFMVKTGG